MYVVEKESKLHEMKKIALKKFRLGFQSLVNPIIDKKKIKNNK